MANFLKMDQQQAIIGLKAQGWSDRRIARELGINRRTVRRHASAKCTNPQTGKAGRRSKCDEHREWIRKNYESGLSVERLHQDLVREHGFEGSYHSVFRFVQQFEADPSKRVYRMECEPAQEAQIDYGTGYYLRGESGRLKKAHLLLVTLSHSRKFYVEATLNQTSESFIRSLENAFRHFGGVPHRLCPDNLAAAVKKADWYEPELNPKLRSFAEHYGTLVMPARPYQPTDKGKVEAGVKYVKNNALKGKSFDSLAALNEHLRWWMANVADLRIHGTTKRQVQTHFLEIEKPALKPLPSSLFPSFEEGRRNVHRDSYVEVKGAYYEVPPQYIGKRVWTRWDARMVRIFDHKMQPVVSHTRLEPGKFSRVLGVGGCHESVAQSVRYFRTRVVAMGEHCLKWADAVIAKDHDTALRRLQGLLQLKDKHTQTQLNEAARKAVIHGHYTLKDLRCWLTSPQEQETFAFLSEHELIRNPQTYDQIASTADLFN
jgi:transposase